MRLLTGPVSWGVSNVFGCFKSIGGDLSAPLCFECVVIVCSECYGVF